MSNARELIGLDSMSAPESVLSPAPTALLAGSRGAGSAGDALRRDIGQEATACGSGLTENVLLYRGSIV